MKWAGYLLSLIWRTWFLIVFIIVFFIFIPPLFFFTAIKKNNKTICHLTRYWSKLTLFFSFIYPRITCEEEINQEKNYIFCPNHVSTLDIPFILAIIPLPLQFIGKAELTKIPLFGYFFKNNAVIVDRKNKRDSYTAFLESGKKIDAGLSMCFFAEGGIPKENIVLKKFKNGPFKLAIEKNIMIIPITMPDNKYVFPQKYFKGRPGFVRATIHKAIDPNNLQEKNINNLNKLVYNTIFNQLKNYESKR